MIKDASYFMNWTWRIVSTFQQPPIKDHTRRYYPQEFIKFALVDSSANLMNPFSIGCKGAAKCLPDILKDAIIRAIWNNKPAILYFL